MAIQTAGSPPAHMAQVVANAFVERYYKVLLTEPESFYKFYEDSSMLSWPGPDGEMTSVKTIEGIKEKIFSLDYNGYTAEITTVDAQDSYKEGVIVLVTGCLFGKDNAKKSFTQTFFLARHSKGYYVLNDVLRFLDVLEAVTSSAVNDANENVASPPLTPNQESARVPDHPRQNDGSSTMKVTSNGGEVCDSSDTEGLVDSKVSVKEVVSSEQSLSSSKKEDGDTIADSASNKQEDQKMSYASVVAKETTVTSPVQSSPAIIGSSSTHQQQRASAAPKSPALRGNSAPRNSSTHTEGKGIFIGNLPADVSVEQLDSIFKKFGPIKRGGIHTIICEDKFCYGFVEFESSNSARNAIETLILSWLGQKKPTSPKKDLPIKLEMAEGGPHQERVSSATTKIAMTITGTGKILLKVVAMADISMGTVVKLQDKLEAHQEAMEKLIRGGSTRTGVEKQLLMWWREIDCNTYTYQKKVRRLHARNMFHLLKCSRIFLAI
ncbi:unnamed protein product [Camellia sinensis]